MLNPALIGQAPAWEVAFALSCALIGVALISSALQGYISLVGPVQGALEYPLRILLFFGGVLIAMPQNGLVDMGYGLSFILGAALCAVPVFLAWRAPAATA